MEPERCADPSLLFTEEAFRVYAPCMYRPTYEAYGAKMGLYASDPSVRIFICRGEGKTAGMLVLKRAGRDAEIVGIAAAEELRRRGIGRSMLRRAAEAEGLRSLTAQTDDEAVGFYRRCGFTAERTVVRYPDGDAVRYRCVWERRTAERNGSEGEQTDETETVQEL